MNGVHSINDLWLAEWLERYNRLADIKARFRTADDARTYWNCVRDAWAEFWEQAQAGTPIDPYFLDWKFTPIEREAWNCIRRLGKVRLYPQVPVDGVFIDFGDPHQKIGVELDGKAYHDRGRDAARDLRLWNHGWRIFRIPGSEAVKWIHPPTEPGFANDAERDSHEYNRALELFCRTGDGVLWALKIVYYRSDANKTERLIAEGALEDHRLVEFPLFDGREDDDE